MTNEMTADDCMAEALKRLNALWKKYRANISDDKANILYWQIEALTGDIQQAAGIPYDGPPLGGAYTRQDELMDDWALDDLYRSAGERR